MIAAGILLGAGAMLVPIRGPLLPASERFRYLWVAISAAVIVIAVDAAWIRAMRPRRQHRVPQVAAVTTAGAAPAYQARTRLAPLTLLRPELVPARLIVVTGVIAVGMVVGAAALALPSWAIVSAGTMPWTPLLFVEGIGKYQHYGLYALFGAIALLQAGHLGEHTVQVIQVFVFNGDLSRAHGVFHGLRPHL